MSTAAAPAAQRLELHACDGHAIVAHRFDAQAPRAVVVVGAAMGVPQDFYFDFARHLATRGYTALTFDYRGVGHSAPRSLRRFPATLTNWMRHDYDAALRAAHALAQGRPLYVVGHSLGAQLPAASPSGGLIDAMATVAGGSGYFGGMPLRLKPFVALMWFGIAPIAMPLAGYFPGRRLKIIGDVPSGVMRQWRRWCMKPDYLLAHEPGAREAYARARFPILSLSFTDDLMMPQVNIDTLQAHFRNATRQVRRIAPSEAGAKSIGHVGFFRRRFADSLWPIVTDWFDGLTPTQETSR